jgi:hypothetical protein
LAVGSEGVELLVERNAIDSEDFSNASFIYSMALKAEIFSSDSSLFHEVDVLDSTSSLY